MLCINIIVFIFIFKGERQERDKSKSTNVTFNVILVQNYFSYILFFFIW